MEVSGSIPLPPTTQFPRISKANYLYFVRAAALGLIKIGIAKCYNSRLTNLQTGSPDKLELMGLIRPADAEDPKWLEDRLKVKFRHLHAHGEWYRPGADLLAYIAENAISEHQNQWELAQIAIGRVSGGQPEPLKPWTPELARFYEEMPAASTEQLKHAEQVFYLKPRPTIPDGVDAPKGNSRQARMERYRLARGLTA